MKILLVDNGSSLLKKLKMLLGEELTTATWNDLSTIVADEFDLVILSGGSLFPIEGNEKKLSREMELIRFRTKPLIGICYGSELIVRAFGGTIEKSVFQHKGEIEIIPTVESPIFGDKKTCKVYESHEWVIRSLPPQFITLARSEHGIEAFKHEQLPLYGFQFHPEQLVAELYGDDIFKNTIEALKLTLDQ